MMKLVEKHIIKKSDDRYKELDNVCFLSKNLYNATLYAVRQHYFETKEFLNFYAVNAIFTHSNQPDYCALPRKVSGGTQKLVDTMFKSFFSNNRNYKSGKSKVKPQIPKYLDKDGRQVAQYGKQALSFVTKGYVKLSGTNVFIRTDKQNISFARVVPRNGYIVVELGYEVKEQEQLQDNGRYASIDLGISNLATVTSNVCNPFIVNGKPVKAINHFYNKQIAHYKSILATVNNKHTSNRIHSINRIRSNKLSDYFNKASRYIVNHLVSNNINTLVIGYNKGWKQDTNIGAVNNQKFVQIPFLQFVDMLKYKCALVGINVVIQEESYTSKCSFLDEEQICKHDNYLGKRVKRGLFVSSNGTKINADVNGSYNILRKYLTKNAVWNEDLFSNCIQVCSTPLIKSF